MVLNSISIENLSFGEFQSHGKEVPMNEFGTVSKMIYLDLIVFVTKTYDIGNIAIQSKAFYYVKLISTVPISPFFGERYHKLPRTTPW